MKIIVNGQEREVAPLCTLEDLITDLQIESKIAACAVNAEIVKKDQWQSHALGDGDKIELLQFVGGG